MGYIYKCKKKTGQLMLTGLLFEIEEYYFLFFLKSRTV